MVSCKLCLGRVGGCEEFVGMLGLYAGPLNQAWSLSRHIASSTASDCLLNPCKILRRTKNQQTLTPKTDPETLTPGRKP